MTISAEKFQKVLENSRYKGLAPEEILESYFGKALCSKQEERILKAQKQQELLLRMSSEYEGTPAQVELEYFMQMLKGNSREDFEELEQQLKLSAAIFNKLPYRKTQKIYLAVFAAMVTGNPHAFDQGTVGGRLLYQIIQRNLELRNLIIGQIETFPAYKRQRSFLAAGILLDDVSNSVMLYRVEAVKKDGDMHSGVAGFQKEQDIRNGCLFHRKREGHCCIKYQKNVQQWLFLCAKFKWNLHIGYTYHGKKGIIKVRYSSAGGQCYEHKQDS